MGIDEVVDFFKNDIRGLIILAVATSIFASLLYDISKKTYQKLLLSFRKKVYWSNVKRYLRFARLAYASGYAQKDVNMRILITADLLISIFFCVSRIAFLCFIFLWLTMIVDKIYLWIIVVILTVFITFQYKVMKRYIDLLYVVKDLIFGKEFVEKQENYIVDHLEQVFKDLEKKRSDRK